MGEEDAATGNALTEKVSEMAARQGAAHVIVSAAIEAEIATLSQEDAAEFLVELGLKKLALTG